jgi:predicted transcriptional regulator
MWKLCGKSLGVSLDEYMAYYDGTDTAYAIQIGRLVPIAPIPLASVRVRHQGFHPPRSYMYWKHGLEQLVGPEVAGELQDVPTLL